MLCTYCSVQNPDYAEFCTNCGRRLEMGLHTPAAGITPVPGEGMSNGQTPAEQVVVMRESFPAGRDSSAHATFPAPPTALPLASISSTGEHSSVAVLDRVSSPGQQFSEVSNIPDSAVPFQQTQPSERFGSPSDQQSSLNDKTLRSVPPTPTSVPSHNVATLPPPTNGSSPPISVGSPPTSSPPKKGLQDKLPKKWRIMALIALIILLVGGSASFLIPWLHTMLPADTATVTVTPASQHLTQIYGISAVTGTPDASQHQVQARQLSFITPALSKTVKATGHGHQEATVARGKVTITPTSGTIPANSIRVQASSGVWVDVNVPAPFSSGSQTFDALAENAGSGGNIPAYDINGSYQSVNYSPYFTFNAQNTVAFTGGQDAQDYTFVQQSDIDGASTPLINQLTSDAQAAVQKQLRANEQFVGTPESTPNIKTNYKAGDHATDVNVTVTVTSKGEVYDQQAAQSTTADWLKSDAASQLGDHYTLIGDTVIGTPVVVTTDTNGTVSLNVNAEGVWVYQFSDAQKQQIAQLIAGKPLTDAQALLQKQTGIKKVNVSTADGWGTALPTTPSNIKFIVLPVPGLQATPTS